MESRMGRTLALGFALAASAGVSGCFDREQAPPREGERTAERSPGPVFSRLRDRPLRMPRTPRRTCRMTPSLSPATETVPGRPGEAALGDGPVYAAFPGIPRLLDAFPREMSGLAPSSWGSGETVWISAPEYRGAVLVRGRRIDAPGRIGFGPAAMPSGDFRLPAGRWDERTDDVRPSWTHAVRSGWRFAVGKTRIRADGCYAFQIDGESFSDVIVFGAKLQP
jgi:hypothetical protein